MHKFWKLEKAWACAPDESHIPALLNLLSDAEIIQYSDNGTFSRADAQDICSGQYPWFLIYSPENEIIGVVAMLRSNGESAEIDIDLTRLYLFDGETRLSLLARDGGYQKTDFPDADFLPLTFAEEQAAVQKPKADVKKKR